MCTKPCFDWFRFQFLFLLFYFCFFFFFHKNNSKHFSFWGKEEVSWVYDIIRVRRNGVPPPHNTGLVGTGSLLPHQYKQTSQYIETVLRKHLRSLQFQSAGLRTVPVLKIKKRFYLVTFLSVLLSSQIYFTSHHSLWDFIAWSLVHSFMVKAVMAMLSTCTCWDVHVVILCYHGWNTVKRISCCGHPLLVNV